ncbi:cystatin-like 1 isoform X2 [Mus pahari]|uniref:cystatin-like 1 isoform X2 n=1 Tax=Mus pahari TaxID=10093 RepID=UPI000A30463F|nr:cystatin-like 1 isoform X2 [Mus pahari]
MEMKARGLRIPLLLLLVTVVVMAKLTTGVEYLVTVKIGRTKCKKNETKKASCPLQSSKLKKSLVCKSLIYSVPWMNYFQLWNNSCQES